MSARSIKFVVIAVGLIIIVFGFPWYKEYYLQVKRSKEPVVRDSPPIPLTVSQSDNSVLLRLVDVSLDEPVRNTFPIEIYVDNGVRCVQAPCGSKVFSRTVATDQEGFIEIPYWVVKNVVRVRVPGFVESNMVPIKETAGVWSIKIKPIESSS